MKKILLGISLCLSNAAMAKDFTVEFNGILDFSSNFYLQEDAPSDNNTLKPLNKNIDFSSSAAFSVLAKNTTEDERFKYGLKMTLLTSTRGKGSPRYNGSHIFIESDEIGKIEFGAPFDAMSNMAITGLSNAKGLGCASIRFGQTKGVKILSAYDFASDDTLRAASFTEGASFEPARKITYYTPKINDALQFGVSYTPSTANNASLKSSSTDKISTRKINDDLEIILAATNVISFGSTLTHSFNEDLAVKFGIAGEFGTAVQKKKYKVDNCTKFIFGDLSGDEKLSDLKALNIGANFTFKNFGFALSCATTFDSLTSKALDNNDRISNYFATGVSYTQGPAGASLSFLNTNLNGNTLNGYVLGGDYSATKGMRLYGELGYFSAHEKNTKKNPNGIILIMGTSVAF